MRSYEADSIKKAIHTVFDWARVKKAGPVEANLLPAPGAPPALLLHLYFPDAGFTEEEDAFFAREFQVFSLNGSTPLSLERLHQATLRLTELGGQVAISKLGARGMALNLYVPTAENDPGDINAKIRLIQREVKGEMGDIQAA